MSVFVCSDIHACLSAFKDVYKQAKVTDKDKLIILGDLTDGGLKPVETLRLIKSMQEKNPNNVIVLAGNHDMFAVEYFKYNNELAYATWLANVGERSIAEITALPFLERIELINWLSERPFKYETKDFYFTHSMPLPTNAEKILTFKVKRLCPDIDPAAAMAIWSRVTVEDVPKMTDKILISGHTIASNYHKANNIFFSLKNNYINVDCGAKVLEHRLGFKLGMLKLPDNPEDYHKRSAYTCFYSRKRDGHAE